MKVKRRKRMNPLIPIASMGDIAFLLIIFFMLTSNFINEADIKQALASAVDLEKLEESVVSVSIDRDGVIWLQGRRTEIEALEGAVAQLTADRPGEAVMLKVDKTIPHKIYGDVLLSISRAEVEIALVGENP